MTTKDQPILKDGDLRLRLACSDDVDGWLALRITQGATV